MEKEKQLNKYKNLYKYSKSYQLLSFCVKFLHTLFYKNVIVEGLDNIPKEGPIIFAPNHQNALMDPLAVIFSSNKQIVFLARSDIFKRKLVAKILIFLKILPVYRIRDGKDNLNNNDLTFDIAARVLENKQYIGIFPEAQHSNKRRLLNLKKGIPRLAFLAEEKNNFKLGIKIIPVGIYYSKYNRMQSIIHIRYGAPITVNKYKDSYIENPQKAMLQLREVMDNAIRPLIIDIRSIELYDTYESLRRLYVKNLIRKFKLGKLSQINKFKADKITIQALELYEKDYPEKMPDIKQTVEEYEKLKEEYSLSDQSIEKPFLSIFRILANTFILLISLPAFIYGLVNNIFTYFTPKLLVLKIKDKQFHSSVKFGWAIFFIPILYLIQIVIIGLFLKKFWLIVAYAISLPVFGLLARVMSEWITILFEDYRLLRLRNLYPTKYEHIKKLHQNIILKLDLIVTHWNRKPE